MFKETNSLYVANASTLDKTCLGQVGMILANTDDKYIRMAWPRIKEREREREIFKIQIELGSRKRERKNGRFLTSLCFHEQCLTIFLTCNASNSNNASIFQLAETS